MNRQEFINELLGAAQKAGVAQAEVYYHQGEAVRVTAMGGQIQEYTVSDGGGLSLRGLVDGKMGMAYTESIEPESIGMLVRGVLESAALISDLDEQFIFGGSPGYAKVETLGDLGTPADAIDLALALDKAARDRDPRIGEQGMAVVHTEKEAVQIANSHGLNLRHEADFALAYVEAVARDGEKVSTGTADALASNLAALCPQAIAGEAAREALFQLSAAPCEGGEMPVIFRNSAMADLIGAFLGIFSAEAAQKGLSLLADKEGETIAAACVTLVDDPLLAGGLYTRAFDAEGVATFTKNIVEQGTLKTLLHNLKTARKAGLVSTGNAARGGYSGPVGIAPTNLCLQGGGQDLRSLMKTMEDGLVITAVEGLHAGTNAVSGDFSLLSRGYLVRGGKQARAVEQVTVAGNFYALLRAVRAVGNDVRAEMGHVRSPSVLVERLSVTGK